MLPYSATSSEGNFDAFEELESPFNKSSDHNVVDESAINLNKDNESATNQDEVKKQLVFKLDLPTRDEIIVGLNRYTQVLCGEKGEAAPAKDKLMNDNANLYQLLIHLPLKSNTNVQAESRHSNRVTLDLDPGTRSQIVSTLFANHTLLVHVESTSEEKKMKAAKCNNDLVIKLMRLPISINTGPADESSALNGNVDQLAKRGSELAEEVVRLNEKIDEQKSALDEKATKHAQELTRLNQMIVDKETELIKKATKISGLTKKVDELEKTVKAIEGAGLGKLVKLVKLAKLSTGQLDLDLNRKQADFECELNGVEAFLETKAPHYSRYFFAGNLAWCLEFNQSVNEYLSIYLFAKNYTGGTGDWSIRGEYEMSIVNQSGGLNSSASSTKDFGTKTFLGWGLPRFISIESLRAGGYIKDNKIRVQVHLKVGELIRAE